MTRVFTLLAIGSAIALAVFGIGYMSTLTSSGLSVGPCEEQAP